MWDRCCLCPWCGAAVETLRDFRLRHHFGDRYDFRNNLIDWDYQSTVKPNAGCVHYTQYRSWRNTGVAFEFGDQAYVRPNRTMASFAEGKERGRGSTLRRGFWTDVVVSPYHAVGTSASIVGEHSKKMFDIHNRHTGSEQWRHVRRDWWEGGLANARTRWWWCGFLRPACVIECPHLCCLFVFAALCRRSM